MYTSDGLSPPQNSNRSCLSSVYVIKKPRMLLSRSRPSPASDVWQANRPRRKQNANKNKTQSTSRGKIQPWPVGANKVYIFPLLRPCGHFNPPVLFNPWNAAHTISSDVFGENGEKRGDLTTPSPLDQNQPGRGRSFSSTFSTLPLMYHGHFSWRQSRSAIRRAAFKDFSV